MNQSAIPVIQTTAVLDFISHSPAQTERFGQRLGGLLQAGDLILLQGNFGAGKTHLVRGIARGLNSPDLVTSPSFVLINEYRAEAAHQGVRLYHIDLYRIEDPAELAGLGLFELLEGNDICCIEWAERATAWLPNDHLMIQMQHLNETKRVLRLVPNGERYRALVEQFKGTTFGQSGGRAERHDSSD